ncbi:hypothetical protein IFM89_005505 [Coptis chinensis]|uniref:F-box associated beta-propeller type 3 domain-containing protein n=1 Tax=Coptis chinensis TaxID=261450 RepID=A0A835GZ06_9MAGN|nr:hypothetical protein IFM89_005505 [Coptis chinensis]
MSAFSSFLIYNPITREILELPEVLLPPSPETNVNYLRGPSGFAFDATTSTYKVVFTWVLHNMQNGMAITAVHIYSLGSGWWRRIEDLPTFLHFKSDSSQVFLNGALHWEINGVDYDEPYIGAIDIATEKFIAIQQPLTDFESQRKDVIVGTLRGYLTLVVDRPDQFLIWVMKDYGVV